MYILLHTSQPILQYFMACTYYSYYHPSLVVWYHNHVHILQKSTQLFILYSRAFILCANTAWLLKVLRGGCHIKCLLFVEFNVCVCTADFQTPKWTSVTSLWHPCVVLRAWEWVRLNWIQTSMWVADIKHNVSSGHDIHTDSNTATTFYILILRLKMIRPSPMLTTNVTWNSFSISKYS